MEDHLPPSEPIPADNASDPPLAEEPQVFAIHHRPGGWSLSRRGMLAGAAGLAASGCAPKAPLPPVPPVPKRPGVPMPNSPDGTPVSIPCDNRLAHSATITLFAGSPDGRYAASADEAGAIHLWSVRPPASIFSLKDKIPGVRRLVFDAGIQYLAAVEERTSVTIFKLQDGSSTKTTLPTDMLIRGSFWVKPTANSAPELLMWFDNGQLLLHPVGAPSLPGAGLTQRANLPTDLRAVAVTFDERIIGLARATGEVELRRVDEPQTAMTIGPYPGEIVTLAFSRQGDLLAIGCHDGAVRLMSAATGALLGILRDGHIPVESLAFDAQGQFLVVTYADKTCRRWPVRRTLLKRDGDLALRGVIHAAWLPTGDLVFLESDRVVHWKEGQPHESVRTIVRESDLKQLSIGGSNGVWMSLDQNGNLQRWKTEAVQTPQACGTVPSDATTLVYDSHSQTVFVGSPHEQIASVPTADPSRASRLGDPGDGALSLAVAPGGDRIAAVGAQGNLRTWLLPAEALEPGWPNPPAELTGVCFSGDGRYLAASGPAQCVIWSCATRHVVSSWQRETMGTSTCAFDPEGNFLLLGEVGGVSLWEVRTGKRVCELDAPSRVIWLGVSPSGKQVAAITEHGALCLWTSNPLASDKTWTWGSTGVPVATLSPGANALLIASGQAAAVWDLTTDAAACLIDFDINFEDIKGYEYDDEFAGRRITYKVTVEWETTVHTKRTIVGRVARPKPPPPPPSYSPSTYSRPSYSPPTYTPSSSYHYWRPN